MSVDDSGLYERLHDSEKRRRVAAMLIDSMRDHMKDHLAKHPDDIREHFVSLELGIGWSDTVLRALAGDFEYVKSTIPPGHELVARLQVVLGE
jgi:hypothetical protein